MVFSLHCNKPYLSRKSRFRLDCPDLCAVDCSETSVLSFNKRTYCSRSSGVTEPKDCCNLSAGVALDVRFTTNGMCAKNNTHIYIWRKQAIIEWSWHVNSIVACCHSAKLCAHAARNFRSQQERPRWCPHVGGSSFNETAWLGGSLPSTVRCAIILDFIFSFHNLCSNSQKLCYPVIFCQPSAVSLSARHDVMKRIFRIHLAARR